MKHESDNRLEQRIQFVAKHYRQGSLDTDNAWKQFARQQRIHRSVSFRRSLWASAAVCLLLLGLGVHYWIDKQATEWIAITTEAGQRKDVYLPDSTLVSLAEHSVLRYERKQYGKEGRVVKMSGKAFFQVQRDESRPFSIQMKEAEVRVLGTCFQAQEEGKTTSLFVESGKVRFTAGKERESAVLTAGMSAHYAEETGLTVSDKEEEINNLAWKTRRLRFYNTPLQKVIRDISNAYQVQIVNQTDLTGKEEPMLTSFFEELSLEEVLLIINQTLDVRLQARPVNHQK
ncbi:DUF4974 domain-containing protein [Parabacteroides sp. 52]|uniref:FecR family protein n=1 Tax=unclassified Parabacteroides TaxID=2649774 RepID=UPI0013D473CD|nr:MULTISPECIES: FecR domain-containing protein [unclassified Parabacteroides]MDH6535760.1 transmembrane sensor [Parabacteroides sp. PM5-20]NDV56422.1 DUF4974 domain-containing protein [Parabacteroides sp. 52]